jgi:hypothetical protein
MYRKKITTIKVRRRKKKRTSKVYYKWSAPHNPLAGPYRFLLNGDRKVEPDSKRSASITLPKTKRIAESKKIAVKAE